MGTELVDIQLKFYNEKYLIISPAQLIISSDASSQSWEASCQKKQTGGGGGGGHWSKEERKFHINVLDRTEGSQIGINDVHDAT